MRGNAVHALVGGGVDQHGVIEGERTVESDGSQHTHDKERKPAERQRHRTAHDHAGEEETGKELDLHALHVGDGTEQRHEHGDDQRCDGLRIAPRRHDVRFACGLEQRIRINRHHGCGKQYECGIADVVDDPFLLAGGHLRIRLRRFRSGIGSGAVRHALTLFG